MTFVAEQQTDRRLVEQLRVLAVELQSLGVSVKTQ